MIAYRYMTLTLFGSSRPWRAFFSIRSIDAHFCVQPGHLEPPLHLRVEIQSLQGMWDMKSAILYSFFQEKRLVSPFWETYSDACGSFSQIWTCLIKNLACKTNEIQFKGSFDKNFCMRVMDTMMKRTKFNLLVFWSIFYFGMQLFLIETLCPRRKRHKPPIDNVTIALIEHVRPSHEDPGKD